MEFIGFVFAGLILLPLYDILVQRRHREIMKQLNRFEFDVAKIRDYTDPNRMARVDHVLKFLRAIFPDHAEGISEAWAESLISHVRSADRSSLGDVYDYKGKTTGKALEKMAKHSQSLLCVMLSLSFIHAPPDLQDSLKSLSEADIFVKFRPILDAARVDYFRPS